MADISFDAYLGWTDITDPANIPEDARVISANDLLRYENFGLAAVASINQLATDKLDVATAGTTYAAKSTEAGLSSLGTQVDAITADPLNAVTSLYIPAKAFDVTSGASAYGPVSSRLGAYPLTFNADTYLSTALRLPSHWTKMVARLVWVNTLANAGNVSWAAGVQQWAIGETINAAPTSIGIIAAANATPWIATETAVGSTASPIAVTASKFQSLRIQRNGTSANDTLDAAIGFLGVVLEKVA